MELSAKLVRSQLNFFKPFVANCSLEVTRKGQDKLGELCLLYTSPRPRD